MFGFPQLMQVLKQNIVKLINHGQNEILITM